ncbi:UNVERIFIED_CONTAM: hypothetical protein Sradi_0324900 [Sesamum radiatum]|uniref:SAM domain-containing protein n=1 Tax=Sesamum radiatum TaxID=300843 RepID=A0AAW2W7R3_SESRA
MACEDRRVGVKDLRLKLQRRSIEQATRSVRGSVTGGARDLREKLSGSLYSRPVESKPAPLGPKPAPEVSKPPRKSVVAQAPAPETKATTSVPKKKVQQKVESVDNFLQSLGLEKYSITFQAEEVDMTALIHMKDEDLKALGIPMPSEPCLNINQDRNHAQTFHDGFNKLDLSFLDMLLWTQKATFDAQQWSTVILILPV